jgi:hypothetical protein
MGKLINYEFDNTSESKAKINGGGNDIQTFELVCQ